MIVGPITVAGEKRNTIKKMCVSEESDRLVCIYGETLSREITFDEKCDSSFVNGESTSVYK